MTRPMGLRTCVLLATMALAGCAVPQEADGGGDQDVQTRSFLVVTSALDFDEETIGVAHDVFVPTIIVVNQGDTVEIDFRNAENLTETEERHTFTMLDPYAVDFDLLPEEARNATFEANESGVFDFICTYHQPTMRGQLVVLG